MRFILISLILAGTALAQEPTGQEPSCASDRQRGCWVDLNLKARTDMEAKMAPCEKSTDYGLCIRALGWRQPLFEDERFKPRNVFRK